LIVTPFVHWDSDTSGSIESKSRVFSVASEFVSAVNEVFADSEVNSVETLVFSDGVVNTRVDSAGDVIVTFLNEITSI